MERYKYYLDRDCLGYPHDIYHGALSDPADFPAGGLWRAKKNGSWSAEGSEIKPLINLWLKGDFDPGEDEISEEQAQALLAQWRDGYWPGRE
jgi:hypothetical protein